MKNLYSSLIAILALVLFASLADAGPFPTWDKQINTPDRFKVLDDFKGRAVLDKETGLVWDQHASTSGETWFNARFRCVRNVVGGRQGWRLPTVHELLSVVDLSGPPPGPTLPLGHPFSNVQRTFAYWTGTTTSDNSTQAWLVDFDAVGVNVLTLQKGGTARVWCVRGGAPGPSEY